MTTTDYLPLSTFSDIMVFVEQLEVLEIKPCISLVRHGIIPLPIDTILWESIPMSLFNKLFQSYDNYGPVFTRLGEAFFRVSTNPLISSSIISFCLAKVPTEEEIANRFLTSISKEVQVMESSARPPKINWKVFFTPTPGDCFILPHQRFDCTPFAMKINQGFRRFRDSIAYSRIWPHGTSRGISTSAQRSLEKLRKEENVVWMTPEDFRRQISSMDVVKHYLRNGSWPSGACELKQKWYPSGLAPRTYFAQGGDAIRVSCYLRNFFNDFTDSYIPTERRARVDGSRLICPDGGYFFIYDLTSFTSNFHEQLSFLLSMAAFFRDTRVYLVGHELSMNEKYLGEMIEEYCDVVNNFPPFEYNKSILDFSLDSIVFFHHVAGFLGVPGNLATCTLAHGISVGITTKNEERQSCAGDDGNIGLADEEEELEATKTLHCLGKVQEEKLSTTKDSGRGSYLKREFKQDGEQGVLVDRVDFPLMGAVNLMQRDDPRFPELSKDRTRLRKSIASSTAKLVRDLYSFSAGYYKPGVLEYVLLFLKDVYAKGALPTSGMVRGLYGSDLDLESFRIDAAVVFPISERYFRRDPDVVLTEDFLPWVVEVPVWTDEDITFQEEEEWYRGETRVGKSSPTLEKLTKFGYLEREETERITLVGEEARLHFRRFTMSDFQRQEYRYTALTDLSKHQIKNIGLSGFDNFRWKDSFYGESVTAPLQFRSRYKDPDRVVDVLSESSLGLEDLY